MAEINLTVEEKIEAKVDTAIITITIGNKDESDLWQTYEDAAKIGSSKFNKALEIIKKFNVTDENIKSSRLSVNRITRTIKHEDQHNKGIFDRGGFGSSTETSYENRFLGYGYNTTINVEVPSDSDYLAKLYCELSTEEDIKAVNISFLVKNVDYWKDLLLEKLVKKAKHQAEILAKAGGLSEVSIINITKARCYSSGFMRSASLDNICYDYDCECDDSDVFEDNISTLLESNIDKPIEMNETIEVKFETV